MLVSFLAAYVTTQGFNLVEVGKRIPVSTEFSTDKRPISLSQSVGYIFCQTFQSDK